MMAEYIERKAALAVMNEVVPCICHDPDGAVITATKDSDMLKFLRAIPAADVVPVKHGRWGKADCFTVGNKRYAAYQCSVCGALYPSVDGFHHCPNCGAKMDGDGE